MQTGTNSARELLDAVYENLRFNEGELVDSAFLPNTLSLEEWVEKGDWLSLANFVGVEKIFFIRNNPVIVFAKSETNSPAELRQLFNKIWCMARPSLLFLAQEGELAVYDLTKAPTKTEEEWNKLTPLNIVRTVLEVATELKAYQREMVESGKLFGEKRFGKSDRRADQSLVKDLKVVRKELIRSGLSGNKLKYAHALIGRSIFIRYLEDRKILTEDYFYQVASQNVEWREILNTSVTAFANTESEQVLYLRVLSNKEFTYALFDKLSQDFNGDMFPSNLHEKQVITQEHLTLLKRFLLGETGPQQKLFLWAYKFDIIPVELISSIYEEFYHTEVSSEKAKEKKGTHYTPSSLVEFVLSKILTPDFLEKNPRILDPACGSGIFLVESFRRIVRYKVWKNGEKRLSNEQLRDILQNQLAGVEINPEAIRVAAFSLYLALLHYQEPKSIIKQIEQGIRLPYLIYREESIPSKFCFNSLVKADVFDLEFSIKDENNRSRFNSNSFDAIVGNPPWGAAKENSPALTWCKKHNYPVGDEDFSQAFIWRTFDLLSVKGFAGLLVSTGVFFKRHSKSQLFRTQWLKSVRLKEVVNFAHVRDIFFSSANSPFACVVFQKGLLTNNTVRYWSAKKNAQAKSLRTAILYLSDLKLISQNELLSNDKLWKVYWWGNHKDKLVINELEQNPFLSELKNKESKVRLIPGRGFEIGTKEKEKKDRDLSKKYRYMRTQYFSRYDAMDLSVLSNIPLKLRNEGVKQVYEGLRIIIKKGILQKSHKKGQIIARMESEPFCFTESIYGIKLENPHEWEIKIILAIFWSSLARYYYFLTGREWGTWHDNLKLTEICNMPIRFPENDLLKNRIINIVDKLRNHNSSTYKPQLVTEKTLNKEIAKLEHELDEAIFDLYELGQPERDQILDMCEVGIEFFYNHFKSDAVKPISQDSLTGLYKDIPSSREQQKGLQAYLQVFLHIWNRELEPDGEFSWQVINPLGDWPLLAVVFSTQEKGEGLPNIPQSDYQEWSSLLKKLENQLLVPFNSKQIYIDGMVRAVTDTDIIIIKRNEKRLWTRSMAREDAEATLLQAIHLQEAKQGI